MTWDCIQVDAPRTQVEGKRTQIRVGGWVGIELGKDGERLLRSVRLYDLNRV